MTLTRKLPVFLGIGAVIIAFFAMVPFIGAQQDQQTGGNGLQISPTRSEVSASPGEVKPFSLTIKNVTDGPLTAKAFINDFESDNVSGTPQIIVDENQRTPNSIANMLKGLSDIELAPGQTKEVKLSLDVPGNASPGAYYGAVRYAAVPKDAQQSGDRQVSLTASVAHLVFLEVAGDINEQIQLESLKAQLNGKASSFFIKKPNESAVGIKNLGNGFSRPFGTVTVNNMLGKQVSSYEVNDTSPKGIILPNSSRVFTSPLNGVSFPGRYSQTAAVAYGNGGEVVTYKSSFWYVPIWAIVVLLLILIAIALGIRKLYKNRTASSSKKQ